MSCPSVCPAPGRALLVAIVAAGLAIAAQAGATPLFVTRFPSYDVTGPATAVAVGELNGDGLPDVVAVNSAGTLSVLPGAADGSLGSRTDCTVGNQPYSLALADLNGDGKLDAVIGDYDNVAVLLGAGDGSFGAAAHFPTGQFCRSVALADWNGDGRTDAAAVNYDDNTLSLLWGNGDGTFGAAMTLPTGSGPMSVAAGDLNGDGKSDLATASRGSSAVSVLFGNGNGTFTVAPNIATPNQPSAVAIVDLDGDGKRDLVTANSGAGSVSTWRGNGDGSFGARSDWQTGLWPVFLLACDTNGDGHLDLLTADQTEYTVSVRLGDGHGNFGGRVAVETAAEPVGMAIADLDTDGVPDLVTAQFLARTVSTLRGHGDGTFGPMTAIDLTGRSPYQVATADLDDDGELDLVTCNSGGSTVTVLRGRGDGRFDVLGDFDAGPFPRWVHIADVNGDGVPDVAVAHQQPNAVSVLIGHGDGTFGARTDYGTYGQGLAVAIADMNGDGKPDLAAASANGVNIMLNHGDGTFASGIVSLPDEPCWSIATGDMNGDGKQDVIVTPWFGRRASVLAGNGDGTFGTRTNYTLPQTGMGVSIDDLNGDARPDFAVFTEGTSATVFLANANGTFTGASYSVGRYPVSGGLADLDGDAHLDLVTANSDVGTISVLLGTGSGAFGSRTDHGVGANPLGVAFGDFDGDARTDVAIANAFSHSIDLLVHPPAVPEFVQQPATQAVCAAQTLSLAVQASGLGLSYRWRRNGTPLSDGGSISGSATATLAVASMFPVDAGDYDVVVSNTAGSATSAAATVTVCDPPVFVSPPASTSRTVGSAATFGATLAASCTTPALAWQKNGVALVDDGRITGSATATLTIDPLEDGDAGYYGIVATNACGTQTSSQASLTVKPCAAPPTIDTQPADVAVPNGQAASFTVGATGCVAPTYQWLKGGVPIRDATAATLTIPSVTDADADYYQVSVTAGGVSALSRVAVLNVPGPVLVNASHRIMGTPCVPVVEFFWQINVPCAVRVDYEYTNVSNYAGPLTRHATFPGPAASGLLDVTPTPGTMFVCYQITATDAASRTATTTRRMASIPTFAFTLNLVQPSIVTYPYRATLVTSGDAVAVGVTVTNANCTSLDARVTLDQAQLRLASPRNSAGAVTLPMPIAGSIPAGSTARMPTDLKFLRSQVNVATGTNATFSGRLKIETAPVQYKTFSGTVRMP